MGHCGELLSVRNVSKGFGGTQALDDVSLSVRAGQVHTLIGENGAGKSTLIKILGGVHRADAGEILLEGEARRFPSPREAQAAGIIVIPQEMRIVPAATVAENVTLGAWPERRVFGMLPAIDHRRMREHAAAALARLDFQGRLDARMDELTFAERQLVVIARALSQKARLLILDEPTASLEHREAERLFGMIERLKAEGVGIIYVSHRLDEIVRLSDACTVLRDGRVVACCGRGEIDKEQLVRLMTGRDLEELHRPHDRVFGEAALGCRIDDESVADVPATLAVRTGEVLGLAGLLGSGTTEFLRRLFGADLPHPGDLAVAGRPAAHASPGHAIANGIGYVPGERRLALVMDLSVRDNIVLPNLRAFSRGWRMDEGAVDRLVAELMEVLDIRPRDPSRRVGDLSGGNQQKVIFARWLVGKVGVLLLDEPTQGIDVAAKARIHKLMHDFVAEGGAVIFTSSEIPEVMLMSDAVIALRKGQVVGSMRRGGDDYNERTLREALGG